MSLNRFFDNQPREWERHCTLPEELKGKYTPRELLGRGAHGDVISATRVSDGLTVAIKINREQRDRKFNIRYKQEAEKYGYKVFEDTESAYEEAIKILK